MLTLEQILDRTETLEDSKKFNYIEQSSINGKSSIVAGNEDLKTFNLQIKLHHSFCNPTQILAEIDALAAEREVINYFHKDVYIGDYVINDYKVNIAQRVNGAIIYAELELNLLENPESLTEFSQQAPAINLDNENIIDEIKSKNALSDFKKDAYSFNFNIPEGLSDLGSSVFSSLKRQIIEKIKDFGLFYAKNYVQSFINNLNLSMLSEAEQTIIKNELSNVSTELIEKVMRA